MSEFTASNGLIVTEHPNGPDGLVIERLGMAGLHRLNCFEVAGLREFFQKENDDRLGRWRWPENPDYVVYPWGDVEGENSCIAVVNERTGGQSVNLRFSVRGSDESARAARAYFYAHPHPKPWDEAKPGEVWVFTLRDAPELSHAAVLDDCATWSWTDGGQIDLTTIADARRIWPEDKEVEK